MNQKQMISGRQYPGTTGQMKQIIGSSKPFGAKLEKGAGSNPAAPATLKSL